MPQPEMPKWFSDDGNPVSCTEKIKVMNQNMTELYQAAQDAFEDALLMGCSEAQLRDYLQQLIAGVENPDQQPSPFFRLPTPHIRQPENPTRYAK